jgi:hypothetical protein
VGSGFLNASGLISRLGVLNFLFPLRTPEWVFLFPKKSRHHPKKLSHYPKKSRRHPEKGSGTAPHDIEGVLAGFVR